MIRISVLFIVLILCISACTSERVCAPVVDATTMEQIPQNGVYRVIHGDTLYSIAWRYGLDYRYLAKRNRISRPYAIHSGQLLYLNGHTRQALKFNDKPSVVGDKEPTILVKKWYWPTRGRVITTFSSGNKGIDIKGNWGNPVVAAASGKVVYSGNGLRAYSNLILIKHNSLFLSAYGHNSKALVREGDWVKAGQKIAEMGYARRNLAMLHFEIRREGRPVNPLSYLGKK